MKNAFGFGLILVSQVACGSLGNSSDQPPLATVRGELTNPQSISSGTATRVAVLWRGETTQSFRVAEDLPVQPVFPSQFHVTLSAPPPPEAMDTLTRGSETLTFAAGTIVAYEDLNANGKLDLVEHGADSYVDRILGANTRLLLAYFEGALPADAVDGDGNRPRLGYNLFQPPTSCIDPIEGGDPACTSEPLKWLSIEDTLYTLPLTADPKFADMMCRSHSAPDDDGAPHSIPPSSGSSGDNDGTGASPGSGSSGSSGGSNGSTGGSPGSGGPLPAETFPSPTDPELECAPDGKSYTYGCHPTVQKLCGADAESSCGMRPIPSPVPAGWPCPVH